MKNEQPSPQSNPGEQKIQEYINRIKNGESKNSILKDLPPSFVSAIEAGLNPKMNADESTENTTIIPPQYRGLNSQVLEEIWTVPNYIDPKITTRELARKERALNYLKLKEQKEIDDKNRIEEIKHELGIQKEVPPNKEANELATNNKQALYDLVNELSKGRIKGVADLYKNYLDKFDDTDSRINFIEALFSDVYKKYRVAEYPNNPQEETIWENALKNKNVNVNNNKKEWQYRGVFPQKDRETVTRGSFNVNVTEELINSLDNFISSGKIKANYKFGEPGTTASPSERHDSISIYFLEEPSEAVLKELANTIKPYVRGNNLLGKKIDDGFYISEIGSVETKHIEKLINDFKTIDLALAQAIANYTSSKSGQKTTLKMSEAQYYAIKDVANVFGYKIHYDNHYGFVIKNNYNLPLSRL